MMPQYPLPKLPEIHLNHRSGNQGPLHSVDYQKTTLTDVVADLTKRTGITFRIDQEEFADEEVETDKPVVLKVNNTVLGGALERILEPLECTYAVRSGEVLVIPEAHYGEYEQIVVYNVRDFAETGHDTKALGKLIQENTSGLWEDTDGDGGELARPVPGTFVVKQIPQVHAEVALFLEKLRKTLSKDAADGKLPKATKVPQKLSTRVYDPKEFHIKGFGAAVPNPVELKELSADQMAVAIPKLIEPNTWKVNGGKGDLAVIGKRLVIRQTATVHTEIDDFIRQLHRGQFRFRPGGGGFFNVE